MLTIHEGVLKLLAMLEDLTLDAQKFDEGNSAAGTRVSKTLMGVMKESKAIRKAVFAIKKSRKTK